MVLGKKRKLGRPIEQISPGEKLTLTEKMADKDLLLYLGLTNDSNPLYIQHDYASQTPYKKPVVPSIMLIGIVTSAVSKYLPGPGSHVVQQNLSFPRPVYHYSTITFLFEVSKINKDKHTVEIEISGRNEKDEKVIEGIITVQPPYRLEPIDAITLENF